MNNARLHTIMTNASSWWRFPGIGVSGGWDRMIVSF